MPVAIALGEAAAGIGRHHIAEQVQRWHSQEVPPSAEAMEIWVKDQLADNAEVRETLYTIVETVGAMAQARVGLSEADRQWFVDTLRRDLVALGMAERFAAHLQGAGAISQGQGNIATGQQGVSIGRDASQALILTGDQPTVIFADRQESATPSTSLRHAYLHWLIDQVQAVPLAGVDPKSVREEARRDLDLAAIYTVLMTERPERSADRELPAERDVQRLSALAVLNRERRVALLGDPGSGKSTFVNHVALCMAGDLLGRQDANLETLRTPVPTDRGRRGNDDEAPAPQPWDRGALLPIRVVLREFVARGLPPAAQLAEVDGDTLWRFIRNEIPDTLREVAPSLLHELREAGGVVLLDGLDEVPEADARRVQVKAAVEQFAALFPRALLLVTSRTYAYQRQDWKLRGFYEAVLQPFDDAQVDYFIRRWYDHVGPARGLRAEVAQGQAALLSHAVSHNPRLRELAARPILLTLMASLHAWRSGSLPEKREELYADAVALLLDQWESSKVMRRPDGTYQVIEPSLAEWLRIDRNAIRRVLNQLAFEAHEGQESLVGTADISQRMLVNALLEVQQNPDVNLGLLLAYLRDRAGILEPRGVGVYAFPHRTFQEYLAACHLTDDPAFPDSLADLLRHEPNRWREVTLLAGAKAKRGAAISVWNVAEALCYEAAPAAKQTDEGGYWGGLLGAQVLLETESLDRVAERNRPKVERLRNWLLRTLEHNALAPIDRAQAGDVLARLGDPRFLPERWYVPDEPLLGFVEIPAGRFLMGSDPEKDADAYEDEQPQHEVLLPGYFIGRYPVTVAQFRVFVEESGYEPSDANCLRGLANHPVVSVDWYDVLEYCNWLTVQLKSWEQLPSSLAHLLKNGGCVTLPSEAEWEKAARGTDGRIYPWGDEWDAARINAIETRIGGTSAVGCFGLGRSPYGLEDVSGTVWEWTRSMWGKAREKTVYGYPYDPSDGRENLQASPGMRRVVRGGSCWNPPRLVRCACRGAPGAPGARDAYGGIGFRLALSSLP